MVIKNEIIKVDGSSHVNELLNVFRRNKKCEVVYIEKDGRLTGEVGYDKVRRYFEEGIDIKEDIESLAEDIKTAKFTDFTEEEVQYEIVSKFIAEKDKNSFVVLDEENKPLYSVVDQSRYKRLENRREIVLRYFDELEISFESMFRFYLENRHFRKAAFLPDSIGKMVYSFLDNKDHITLLEDNAGDMSGYDVVFGEACCIPSVSYVSWYDLMVFLYDSKYNVYSKEDNMIGGALEKVKASNLCLLSCPCLLDLEIRTDRENIIAAHPEPGAEWITSEEGLKVFRQGLEEYDMKKIDEMMSFNFIANNTGVRNLDIRNDMLNVINGIRFTTDTPDGFTRSVHMFGPSTLFGVGVEDKNTLPSFVQRCINEHFPDKKIRVVNHGVPRADDVDIARLIRNTPIKSADIIVILYSRHEPEHLFRCALEKVKFLDAVDIFKRPHDMGEIFLDATHWNYKPNKKLSEYLVKEFLGECICNDNGLYDDSEKKQVINNAFYDKLSKDKEFLKSLEALKVFRFDNSRKTGCIIMNANPFTLGHRALVEMSLEQVENLYVFVVQEDKSYFSFEDRFEMVKDGCRDLKNVKVLPTGKIMASAATVPAYFQRGQSTGAVEIDMRNEIAVMAGFIAPALNITVRFMGTEPTCEVTRQLLEQTKELLPYYGVQLVVFERAEIENKPISASVVRKLMKDNKKEEIKKIVPETTYTYLLKKGFIK